MGDISDKKTVVRPPDNASVKATDKVVDNSANREGSVNGELGAMPRAELPSKKTVVGEKIETEGVSVKIKPTERLTSPVLPPVLGDRIVDQPKDNLAYNLPNNPAKNKSGDNPEDQPKDISAKDTPKHLSESPVRIPYKDSFDSKVEHVGGKNKGGVELDKKESILVVAGRAERVGKMRELVVELREEVGRLRERGGEDEGEQLKKADLILRLEDEALLLFVLGEEGKVPKEVKRGEFVGRRELRSYVKRYGINWEEERRALLEAEERGRQDERSKKGVAESKLAERGYFNRSYDSVSDGVKGIVELVGIMGRGYLGYAEGGAEYVGGLVTCCVSGTGNNGTENNGSGKQGLGNNGSGNKTTASNSANNELINRLNKLGVELKGRLDRGDYAGVMLSGILGFGYLESGLKESMARKGGERIEAARRERVLGGRESILGDLEDFSSRQNRVSLESDFIKGLWGEGWEQVGEFSRLSGLSSVGKVVKPVGEGVRGGVDELGRFSYNVTGQLLGGFSGEEWIGRRIYEEKKKESSLVRAGSDIGTGGAGLALTVWTGGGALTAEVLTVAGGKVLLTEAGKGIAKRVGLMGASSGGMGVAGSFADELYNAEEEGRGVEWLSVLGGGASGMADSAAFSGVLSGGVSIVGRGVMRMSVRELGAKMMEKEGRLLARAAEGGGESALRSLERLRSGKLAERYLGLVSKRVGAIGGGGVQGVDLMDASGDVEEVAKAGLKSKSVLQAVATGVKAGVTVYDSADNTVNGAVKATAGTIASSMRKNKVGSVGNGSADNLGAENTNTDNENRGKITTRVVWSDNLTEELLRRGISAEVVGDIKSLYDYETHEAIISKWQLSKSDEERFLRVGARILKGGEIVHEIEHAVQDRDYGEPRGMEEVLVRERSAYGKQFDYISKMIDSAAESAVTAGLIDVRQLEAYKTRLSREIALELGIKGVGEGVFSFDFSDVLQRQVAIEEIIRSRYFSNNINGERTAQELLGVRYAAIMQPSAERLTPREDQLRGIREIVTGLDKEDRVTAVRACGTGKTLVALKVHEEMAQKQIEVDGRHVTLIQFPSIALLSQTLSSWRENLSLPMDALAVCSDSRVGEVEEGSDGDLSVDDLKKQTGIDVTTDAAKVLSFLKGSSAGNNADNKSGNKSGNVPKVIFATYQSSDVIERALKNSGVTIDLAIADEAHRTATKVDSEFSSMLDDEKIPAIKRLFLTATPKIYMQREDEDGEGDVELISMNDESRYGKVVHKYSFRQAVRDGVICDYEVVAIGVSEKDLADQDLADKLGSGTRGNLYDLYLASSRIALAKAVNELGIRNIITFHSSIAKAENYTLGSGGAHLREELERVNPEGSLQFNLNTVNSHMKVEDREKILDKMSENVGGRERGVVHVTSNCKVLSEGVDVRSLDGVQIVDAKSSEIENVQIIGRVMRKSPGKEKGYILVPIVLREGGSIEEAAKDKRLKPLISVIEALKAEDEDLVIELQKRVARENEEGKKGEDEDVNGGENYGEESEEDIGEREDMEKDEKESEEKENEGEKGNGGGGVIRFIGVSEADRLRLQENLNLVIAKRCSEKYELTEEALKAAILKYAEDNDGKRPTQKSDGGVGSISWSAVQKRFKSAKEKAEQGKGDLLFGCKSFSDYVDKVLGKDPAKDFELTEEALKAAILKYVEDNEGRRPTQHSDGGVGPITWRRVEKRFKAAKENAEQGKGDLLFGCESLSDYVSMVLGKVAKRDFVLTEEVLKAAILKYVEDNEGRRPTQKSDGGVGPITWTGVEKRFQAARKKAAQGKGELLFGCESLSDYVDKVFGKVTAKGFVLTEEVLKAAILQYAKDNEGRRPNSGSDGGVGPLGWPGVAARFQAAKEKAEEGKGELLFGCESLSDYVDKVLGRDPAKDFVLKEEDLKAAVLKYVQDNKGKRPYAGIKKVAVGPLTWGGIDQRFWVARKKAEEGKGQLLFGCGSLSEFVEKCLR